MSYGYPTTLRHPRTMRKSGTEYANAVWPSFMHGLVADMNDWDQAYLASKEAGNYYPSTPEALTPLETILLVASGILMLLMSIGIAVGVAAFFMEILQ